MQTSGKEAECVHKKTTNSRITWTVEVDEAITRMIADGSPTPRLHWNWAMD